MLPASTWNGTAVRVTKSAGAVAVPAAVDHVPVTTNGAAWSSESVTWAVASLPSGSSKGRSWTVNFGKSLFWIVTVPEVRGTNPDHGAGNATVNVSSFSMVVSPFTVNVFVGSDWSSGTKVTVPLV